jgi:hypothetical protein
MVDRSDRTEIVDRTGSRKADRDADGHAEASDVAGPVKPT